MSNGTPPIPVPLGWSAKAKRTREQPISFLVAEAMRDPSLVNFAAGLVDPWSLPVEGVQRISQKILSDAAHGRRALQYDTTLGLADLPGIERLAGVLGQLLDLQSAIDVRHSTEVVA